MFRVNHDTPLTLVYRHKGERMELAFSGSVFVLGEDGHTLVHIPRSELGGVQRLDLCHCPVIQIGGKKKWQAGKVQDFLASNKGFEGAFLLLPGSGNWDLDSGDLVLTSREVMDSRRRVSGGRPEVQLVNYRWERDGRYVADHARMLHGKVLEVLQPAVEQEPGVVAIGEKLVGGYCPFEHPLVDQCREVCDDLRELESRRVLLSGEAERDISALVREHLTTKLSAVGVRFVRDIPADLAISAEEIAPELVRDRETLGTVEIPGLGRRRLEQVSAGFQKVLVVWLLVRQVARVTSWPSREILPLLEGVDDEQQAAGCCYRFEDTTSPEDRWRTYQTALADRWRSWQKGENYPQAEEVADPRKADPPPTPAPVVWGYNLLTGERLTAYAALEKCGYGWSINWYEDSVRATEADAETRREAESYITARRLEAELTANAQAVELPAVVPSPYVAPSHTIEKILARAGFTSDQYRILTDVGHWYSSGWSGGRNQDGDWEAGQLSTASFVRKNSDGVWEIGQSGLTHLLEGGVVGDYSRSAFAKPVLVDMGAGDKIVAIQDQFKVEREASEEAHRTAIRSFVRALQAQPAYASLSSDMRAKLASAASDGWGTPTIDEAQLRTEWVKAEALCARQAQGEILVQFGGHFRTMGATENRDFWVIGPTGLVRDPDEVDYRKRYTSEGEKWWRVVGPEELALTWSKAYTAAPHEFVIAKLPRGGCTPEQLTAVEHVECEIRERFCDAVGWGLYKQPKHAPVVVEGPTTPPTADAMDALRAKFGKKR